MDRDLNLQDQVQFHIGVGDNSLFFEKDRVVFSMNKLDDYEFTKEQLNGNKEIVDSIKSTLGVTNFRMDLEFIDANPNPTVVGQKKSEHYLNFFLNERDFLNGVSVYEEVLYKDIYNNIDLKFYNSNKGVKYDFILKPGADIDDIKLKYDGADVKINQNGELIIKTPLGDINEEIPFSYINDDESKDVKVNYSLGKNQIIRYSSETDSYESLTIDPFLTWGTYFEGTSGDGAVDRTQNVADDNGNLYTSGYANNSANDYPVISIGATSYQQNYLLNNHYIFKFNADRQLIWATYYGSSASTLEWSLGTQHIAYHNNTLHIVGNQLHETAPLLNGGGFYQTAPTGRPFWLRFEANTGSLEHATYIGGHSSGDPSIAVSNSGMVAIIQEAYDFSQVPIVNRPGAYNQAVNGGYVDMYLMLLNSSYNQIWGTFLGGPNTTDNFHVTFDNNDNIFFVGEANNSFSPTAANTNLVSFPGSYYQSTYSAAMGNHDLIIGKFSSSGQLLWHTLYGGDASDGLKSQMGNGSRVITDPNTNDLVVIGGTNSSNFPVQNMAGAYNKSTAPANNDPNSGSFSDFNSFILKFDNNGARQWATYWGDDPSGDLLYDAVFAGCGKFILASRSWDHQPTALPYGFNQSSGNQSFLMQLDENFAEEWSAYLGYGGNPRIAYSSFDNRLYMGNRTFSTNPQPVTDPGGGAYYDPTNSGTSSAYMVWELDLDPQIDGDEEMCVGNTLQLDGLGNASGSSWSSSNTTVATVNNSGLVTGLTQGTTIITFETSDGCQAEREITVNEGPTVSAGSDVEACDGNQVTLTATNPDGASISWNNGITDGVGFTPSLGSTTYTVTAELSGCDSQDDVVVEVFEEPSFTVSGSDPTTCGGTDGELVISGLSAGTNYDVSYNGLADSPYTSNGLGEITISGLSEDTYTNFEVSFLSCTGSNSATISLSDPSAPVVNAGLDKTACSGDQITLSAATPGGASLSWDQGVTDGTAFTPPLGTTIYTVTAEENNCTTQDEVEVTVDLTPTVDAGMDLTACDGDQVTLTASNPDGANISWSGGINDGVSFSPSLGVVSYTVTATLGSCPATDDVEVTVNEVPSFTLSSTDPSACSANDGEVTISGLNNNETYEVNYNNGSSFNETSNNAGEILIENLGGGVYEDFEVTLNGCTGTNSDVINLQEPNAPSINAGSNQTVCEGDEVTLTAVNPDNAAISWSGGIDDGVPFNITETTTFTVSADLLGCNATDNVTITVAPEVVYTVTTSNSNCGSGGELVISGLPDGEDYDFSYNGGNFDSFTSDAAGTFTVEGLTPGTYEDFELIADGCSHVNSTSVEIEDDVNTPLLYAGNANCEDGGTYSVTFYTSSNAQVNVNAGEVDGNTIVDIPIGTNVSITSSFGGNCETSILVNAPSGCNDDCVIPDLTASNGICDGSSNYSISFSETSGANITATAGTINGNSIVNIPLGTDVTIIATNGDCLSTVVIDSPEDCSDPCENPAIGIGGINCEEDETLTLSFTAQDDAVITTDNGVLNGNEITGIPSGESVEVIVSVPGCDSDTIVVGPVNCSACQPYDIEFNIEDTQICIGESAEFTASSDTENITFNWFFEDEYLGEGETFTHSFDEFDQSGTYYLVGTDVNDCSETDSLTLEVIRCGLIVPEGFSPNGDGVNDVLVIDGLEGFPNTKIKIFNRWGTEVYSNENYQNDWDGRYQSGKNVGGDELPEGSYFYIIELANTANEEDSILKGHLYIKR